MRFDCTIIGGGAAGLFAAITAGRRGKRVLVIEHNDQVGRKILISGGGRCNFTNREVSAENFVSQNPHFARSALARFTPDDLLRMVRRHGIDHYEKKLGQLFCRHSSRAIVEMLVSECRAAGVVIETGCTVSSVLAAADGFAVETSRGTKHSRKLAVACGGLSFAKVGATDLGYRIAKQFGHKIERTRPSLVALVSAGGGDPSLAGISCDAAVTTRGRSFRDEILFTHRGLSGPAILQISNYWQPAEPVKIDLLPDIDLVEKARTKRMSKQTAANFLSEFLPARIASSVIPAAIAAKRMTEMSDRDIAILAASVQCKSIEFSTTEGYDRAEVTLGGVSTADLDSRTMASRRVPGLYFIGEVVDVTGWLGGYNFQWAWSSGYAAGSDI